MKLAKSLLLGATAAVVSVAAANAADLPSRVKGPAVEYVKICDWITAEGFYVIPGTDTCIRVGGYVRAQFDVRSTDKLFGAGPTAAGANSVIAQPGPVLALVAPAGGAGTGTASRLAGSLGNFNANFAEGAQDAIGGTARGTIVLDARTRTSYGTLRALIAAEGNHKWGNQNGGNPGTGTSGSSFGLDKAFIQWAGITAGRAESFFEFWDAYGDNTYVGIRGSANSSDLFAYTATFGGGFQATISVEDPIARRNGSLQFTGTGPFFAPAVGNNLTASTNSGAKVPDVVGNLYVEQSWGQAQVSGVYHQSRSISSNFLPNPNTATLSKQVSGFAILGGVKINLPMLAAGDFLLLQGVYARGASSYLGVNGDANAPVGGGGFRRQQADFTWNTATGQTQKENGYNLIAELRHYWTPTIYQGAFGSYTRINSGSNAKAIDWTVGGIGNFTQYFIGTQLVWVPVKGFTIGVEGMYVNTKTDLAGGVNRTATPAGFSTNVDSFIGRLRINRSF